MSEQSTSGDPMATFGPNDWLVDELYQQYLTDKDSVDRARWAFFEDYSPRDAEGRKDAPAGNGAPTARPAAQSPAAQSASTPAAGASASPAPLEPQSPPRCHRLDGSCCSSHGECRPDRHRPGAGPEARRRPPRRRRLRPQPEKTTAAPAAKGASPKPRDIPAVKRPGPVSEDALTPLRGAPARVVANMESSLEVPTATSVAPSRRSCSSTTASSSTTTSPGLAAAR